MFVLTFLKRRSLWAALLGLGLVAGPVHAGDAIPFRSSGELIIESIQPAPGTAAAETPVLFLQGRDTGVGNILGRYTSEYRVRAWPVLDENGELMAVVYDGEFTSTTADGATLTAHLHAEAPAGATELEARATVIGGTGRLANVQGSWTSLARLTPTGFVYESQGTLSRPGRGRKP